MLQKATVNFLKAISCNKVSTGIRAILIFSLSLLLVACGSKGERPTIDVVYEKEKNPPTLTELTVTNKCNFTPNIALNDNIIVRVVGDKSLKKPVVTILGQEVEISGKASHWSGEFPLAQGPIRETNKVVTEKVIEFIESEKSLSNVEAASVFRADLDLTDAELVELVSALEIEFSVDLPDPSVSSEKGQINTVQQVVNRIQSTPMDIPVTVSYQDVSGNMGVQTGLTSSKKLKFCEENCECFPTDISGTWENRKKAGSMGVGKSQGSLASWSISDFDLETRGCVFDDTYTFGVEDPESDDTGSFSQFMDNLTWLDVGMNPEGREECAAPLSPWDGSAIDYTYIWDPENKELILKGAGAHIGIPRIQNESNAAADGASGKITYQVSTASTCLLFMDILGANNEWWHFEIEKIKDSSGEPMTQAKCDEAAGGSGGSSADPSLDTDGDGVPDLYDIFPDDSSRTIDTDMDGYANEFDPDIDGDNVPNADDCAPLDISVSVCEGDGSSNTDNGIDLTNATQVPVVISEQFGNAEIIPPTDDSPSIYRVPTAAEDWAGFTMVPTVAEGEVSDALPISFGKGGQVKFNASVIGSPSASVRFRFEKNPATDTDTSPTVPTYTTLPKYIGGEDVVEYTVDIPPMGSRVFNSMIFYIDNKGVSISITDIVVSETEAGEGSEVGPIAFVYQFGGAVISQDIPDAYNLPTGNPGGGFSIEKGEGSTSTPGANTDANPLYFGNGGYISFVGSVPDGGSVGVKFEVQADSHPNHLPNYETDLVTVSGSLPLNYSVSIPEQYDNGYKMVILWLQTPDKDVVLSEIMVGVTAKGDPKPAIVAAAEFEAFEEASYDEDTNTFIFPSTAKSYAGFGNTNTDLVPLKFDNGGCVTFNASAETDLEVRFKFEKQAYPGNKPEMYTDWVTISGPMQEYTVDVPASESVGNTYSSYLMFIGSGYKDLPVVVTDVVSTNTGSCGS
jgi:acyl carrier protein